jgi:hypothetical protein
MAAVAREKKKSIKMIIRECLKVSFRAGKCSENDYYKHQRQMSKKFMRSSSSRREINYRTERRERESEVLERRH